MTILSIYLHSDMWINGSQIVNKITLKNDRLERKIKNIKEKCK